VGRLWEREDRARFPGLEADSMDQLRKILANIQKQLGGMGSTQKLLIGSLAVIMVMALFLVSQYAGTPAMVDVWPGAPAEDQARALNYLKSVGYTVATKGGATQVPTEKRAEAVAALQVAGQQPANTGVVFENILKTQNWINTREQNRQIYKVMLDNWLAEVIGKFPGIRGAKVFVDAPEQVGIGQPARAPKASVTLFSAAGQTIDQATADAAAKLVASSVAGLEPDRVSVIDGTSKKAFKIRTEGELAPTATREAARAIEREFELKLGNLLRDIDGAVVAVTATVDVSRTQAKVTKNLPIGEGSVSTPSKEMTSSTSETQAAAAAEPGVRSNVGADINAGASGRGPKNEQKQEETTYATSIGTEIKQIEDPGGKATRLVATVGVPRGFVAGLIQKEKAEAAGGAGGGAAPAAPTAAEIETRFQQEEARIRKSLLPHVQTRGADGAAVEGEVVVMLMSGDAVASAGGGGPVAGTAGAVGGSFGTIWAMGGGMIDKAVLGLLAAVAMGMMLLMLKKAGKRTEMPSAEELAGLPPPLEAKSDLVGEADESETAMAGIEVGEEEIKATKLRESVSELIKQSPDVAGKLLQRWISVEQ
jgi:flagellar M-ring protein FliF